MSISILWQELVRLSEKLTRLAGTVGEMQRRLNRLEQRVESDEAQLNTQSARIDALAIVPRLRQTARILGPPAWKAGVLIVLLYADFSVAEIQSLVSMLLK